jgi:tRNA threonylcarbamoyl adenosine modification protein YeaZ
LPSNPLVLGFDTSAAHCAAALVCGDSVLAARHEDMARGQAERIMPLLQDVLSAGGKDWSDLSAIGVGIGPGNFTGIRISVAAARGLALGLNIPAIGVSSFEAVAHGATSPGLPTVPGPRGQAYIAPPDQAPYLASAVTLTDILQDTPLITPKAEQIAIEIAQVAASKFTAHDLSPPAPLYIKPADAAPSRDAAPTILPDDA